MKDENVDAKFLRIAAEIAANKRWRKLLAGDWHEEMKALEEIAKHYKGENTATGGGFYVVLIPLGPHEVMGVSAEVICRYRNSNLTDPYEIFWEPENETDTDCVLLCGGDE